MTYILQDFFIAIMHPFLAVSLKLGEKKKNILRIMCFVVLFSLSIYTRVSRGINYDYYIYYTLGCCAIMFLLMILSMEKKLERVVWNKPLTIVLLILFVLMAASEILIPKVQSYIEVVIVIFFGGLSFVWHNHENREKLWINIFTATKITFLILTIISLFFRPLQEGCRYSGFFLNPNSAAYHLIPVIAIYICTFDNFIRTRQPFRKAWASFLGLGMAMFFLFMTQSRTSSVAIFTMLGCWFLMRLFICRKEKNVVFFLKYIVVIGCSIIICYPICSVLLQKVPMVINHPIVFENDRPYRVRDFEYAKVSDTGTKAPTGKTSFFTNLEDLLNTEFLDTILSGRLGVYKAYVERLNWRGHENITIQVGKVFWTSAHNNILQFAYIYGNLTMIPYIILILLVFVYSFLFYVRNYKRLAYALLPFIFVTGFAVNTLFEAVFQPFHRYTALIFWLIVGELLISNIGANYFRKEKFLVDEKSQTTEKI